MRILAIISLTSIAFVRNLAAVEVAQPAGPAHAYPAMFDLQGKKLADGEFLQEMKDGLLQIRITYDFKDGRRIEERAAFQQRPELIQRSWSWREVKDETLQREFKVDFDAGTASARKREQGEMKEWSRTIEIDKGQTFAGFGFTLALVNLRDRLVKGEKLTLHAVGFSPKPQVVSVALSYGGPSRLSMSGRPVRADDFIIRPQIPAIAKLFIKVPDTHIWLTTPPAGFLRWEGLLAEPGDEMVRVDLVPSHESAAATPATMGAE